MGLPYYQLDADFIASTSKLLARRLGQSRREVIGLVADLIVFVVDRTSTEEKPPDGVFVGPDSVMEIEAGAEWEGAEGELVKALVSVGIVERLELGHRFKGTDRYREYWEKRRRDREYREKKAQEAERHRNDVETSSKRQRSDVEPISKRTEEKRREEKREDPNDDGARSEVFLDFWNAERLRRGLKPELAPKSFDERCNTARDDVGCEPLQRAALVFFDDKDFEKAGWPLAVFLSEGVYRKRARDGPIAPKSKRLSQGGSW